MIISVPYASSLVPLSIEWLMIQTSRQCSGTVSHFYNFSLPLSLIAGASMRGRVMASNGGVNLGFVLILIFLRGIHAILSIQRAPHACSPFDKPGTPRET